MKKIKNMPEWARDKYYIVARHCAGELWFFDAWEESEGDDAMAQCWEADAELFRVDECE